MLHALLCCCLPLPLQKLDFIKAHKLAVNRPVYIPNGAGAWCHSPLHTPLAGRWLEACRCHAAIEPFCHPLQQRQCSAAAAYNMAQHPHFHPHTPTRTHMLSHIHTLSISLPLTHTLTLHLSPAHTYTHSPSLSRSHIHTHRHTHTHMCAPRRASRHRGFLHRGVLRQRSCCDQVGAAQR